MNSIEKYINAGRDVIIIDFEVLCMDKKGQGISMNTIVIAAIALLVLVVLTVIFMGKITIFSANSADCIQNSGVCKPIANGCGEGYITYSANKCADTEVDICCKKLDGI